MIPTDCYSTIIVNDQLIKSTSSSAVAVATQYRCAPTTTDENTYPIDTKYDSRSDKPLMAYAIYKKNLLLQSKPSNTNNKVLRTPKDILIAAYTGCNLVYASQTSIEMADR